MIKKSRFFIIIAICLTSIFCTGCWDFKDIHEKKILTAVALDKKDEQIYLYVEYANIEGNNKSDGSSQSAARKFIHVESYGQTIPEARENLNRQLDKQVYLSAISTLIMTESFAKEHLVEYLYRIRANELYRKKTVVVITREDPKKLFTTSNEKDISVGFSIEEMLVTLEEIEETYSKTTSQMLENASSPYTGFLIPCIGLQDKENCLIGYSVVKGSTINGFIPVEESKGIIYLKSNKAQFYYVVPYKDNMFTIETTLKKRKIKPSYNHGEINFDLIFEFDAKLMYGDKKTPYNFGDTDNTEVTKILTEILKNELEHTVEMAQNTLQSDYLHFNDEFRIKYPVEFEEMDWQNNFLKASFDFNVKVKLSDTWMMDYERKETK